MYRNILSFSYSGIRASLGSNSWWNHHHTTSVDYVVYTTFIYLNILKFITTKIMGILGVGDIASYTRRHMRSSVGVCCEGLHITKLLFKLPKPPLSLPADTVTQGAFENCYIKL